MTDRDRQIGQNIARLRGERSQQWLAGAMKERGHRWSQSTVWSVEKGDRPMRLTEALDVAEVLEASLASLTLEAGLGGWTGKMVTLVEGLQTARRHLQEAAESYDLARWKLARHLDAASDEARFVVGEEGISSYRAMADKDAIEAVRGD
ncbi:helix-turn-helix domain-containing protein [Dermacoccus nishinomiyaensis]|uniref:helix-turn-helix domain-containing protein n=1 Tax=Dermacoccus nishinomiyaensis TaxID=1274 RepID=UPI0033A6C407